MVGSQMLLVHFDTLLYLASMAFQVYYSELPYLSAPGYKSKYFVAVWSMMGTNISELAAQEAHVDISYSYSLLFSHIRLERAQLCFFFLSLNWKRWSTFSSAFRFPKLKSLRNSHPHHRICTWETSFILGNHWHLNFCFLSFSLTFLD